MKTCSEVSSRVLGALFGCFILAAISSFVSKIPFVYCFSTWIIIVVVLLFYISRIPEGNEPGE